MDLQNPFTDLFCARSVNEEGARIKSVKDFHRDILLLSEVDGFRLSTPTRVLESQMPTLPVKQNL
jgi:hypothetical protein